MGERKVAKLLTTQDMIEGHLDTQTLKEAVNEDKMVTSRLGKEYASVPMASRLLVENGLLGATPFSTHTAMTASTLVDGDYAVVTNDTDIAKNGVYEKVGENWVYSKYNTQQLVSDLSSVIKKSGDKLYITDDYGFTVASIASEHFAINNLVTVTPSDTSAITDELGFALMPSTSSNNEIALEPFNIKEPLFANTLCLFDDSELSINVPSLLAERHQQYKTNQVTATLSSEFNLNNTYAETSCNQIHVDAAKLTSKSYLTIRDSAQRNFTQISLTVKKPTAVTKSPNLLLIGDSTSNRGLADMLNTVLSSKNCNANFIGTTYGAGANEVSGGIGGLLGECREGWETGDFTYQVNDRAKIITDVDEYLLMSKSEQWPYNPFLRPATDSDSDSIVRNGYVFDPDFYQSRFALDTPDIVVIQLAGNDVRDRDEPELVANYIDNMTLMVNQIKKAWSNVKIILSIANPANDTDRNQLWHDEYAPLIRALLDMQNYLPVTVCPTWAFMTPETGFVITSNPNATKPAEIDAVTGALFGEYSDIAHPFGVNKLQMAKIIAGYIACAADNLI